MRLLTTLLLAGCALAPLPALAQPDAAELQRQIEAMRAEIDRLSTQVAELQARQATPAAAPAAPPAPAPVQAKGPEIAWKGAPEITAVGGWSFKPRGRVQIDSALVALPDAVPAAGRAGIGTEFRRVYLGVDGTIPGGFGYRVEADLANSAVELTDVYLSYKPLSGLTLTVGQQKTFQGLEDMTSDLFTSMLERGAFSSAFGFERRVGFSAAYSAGDLLVQAGVFADDAEALGSDSNNSFSLDGRVVFSPEIGSGRLHIGGSGHYRDLNDDAGQVRYRARPFVHTTDIRLVDTGIFAATGERSFGAELAYINGPFHATVEGHRLTSVRAGLPDPTFWGGYAEVGMLLTPGDTTGYRGGAYDRIRPANPVSDGGIGAIQLNARYDRLDLNSAGITGGIQQAAGLSAIWVPVEYLRLILNYGHLWIDDAAVPAGADPDYQADTVGVRAQVDF
jgi:phosphate-selective porin OprO/OprP